MDIKSDISVVELGSDEYPQLLTAIKNPPERLYCRGDISLLKTTCVAMVGSRRYTVYGKTTAKMIAGRLAASGVTVVSGMASGIDTFSHRGTLDAGGKTIAVLGCGINHAFPVSNSDLMEEISKSGLVMSEYEPDMHANKFTFPQRNRIISGISAATIVVEAE